MPTSCRSPATATGSRTRERPEPSGHRAPLERAWVGQISIGDNGPKWVRIQSALTGHRQVGADLVHGGGDPGAFKGAGEGRHAKGEQDGGEGEGDQEFDEGETCVLAGHGVISGWVWASLGSGAG